MRGPTRIISCAYISAVLVSSSAMSPPHALAETSTAPTAVVLAPGQVNAALLDLGDAPRGWAPLWDLDAAPGPNPSGGLCGGPDAGARASQSGAVAIGGYGFAKDASFGPGIAEWIYEFPTSDAAASSMAATRAAVKRCPVSTRDAPDDPGTTYRITAKQRDTATPAGADEAILIRGIHQRLKDGTETFRGIRDGMYVRKDNHVYVVERFGASASAAQLAKYVDIASTKLDRILVEAPKAASNRSYRNVEQLRIAFVGAGGACPENRRRNVVAARDALDCTEDTVLILYRSPAQRDKNVAFLEENGGTPLLVGTNWVVNTTSTTIAEVQPEMGGEVVSRSD